MRSFLLLAILVALAAEPVTVLQHDFRDGQLPEAIFSFSGQGAKQHVHPQKDGLRIAWTAQDKKGMVGITCKQAVQGDFEITVGYEILHADTPMGGFGIGLSMVATANTPSSNVISIAHRVPPQGGHVYGTDRWYYEEKQDKQHQPEWFPTSATRGKLRLTRLGDEARYHVQGEQEPEFRLLRREPFVDAPLKSLRISADKGNGQGALDVRITDLTIRAGQPDGAAAIAAAPVAAAPGAAPGKGPPWALLAVFAITGLLFLLSVIVLGVMLRKRKPAEVQETRPRPRKK